jgi:hypothetical protein
MERVHARGRQRLDNGRPLFRGGDEFCGIILLLPQRQANHDREGGPDLASDLPNDFGGEAGAPGEVPTVLILTQVGLLPEKLIDEIAVCGVDFEAVEVQPLRRQRRTAVGLDDRLNLPMCGGVSHSVKLQAVAANHAQGTDRRSALGTAVENPTGSCDLRLANQSHMPELWEDPAPGLVHLIDNVPPAVKGILAKEARRVGIVRCSIRIDERALGYNEADIIFGTPTVVARDVLSWNATRRERSGHRRHDDAVFQLK